MKEALTLLNGQFPTTKTEQKELVSAMVAAIESGELDVLRIEATMKSMEDVIKDYRKNDRVREILLDEVAKYPKGIAEVYNATFTTKETGVKYDYSGSGHKLYNEIVEQINDLTEQKKELENEMRIHKSTYVYTDIETGESYEVNPPFRTASQQVVVTIKK
jgi:riboflavin synthase alpha subunit